jgi:asparagine synthase (glutamine-hydrolysing)
MAGWLLISGDDAFLGPGNRAARFAAGEERLDSREGAGWKLWAWRRERGEFPSSGTLHACGEGGAGALAWLGQVLDDSGDVSPGAIDRLQRGVDDRWLADLNGPFAVAMADDRGAMLITDRYRHYPVYIHRHGRAMIASTDIRAVALLVDHPKLDPLAVELLLRSGELIDRRTLLQGVELLPPATVLSLSGQGILERRYWAMRHRADRSLSMAECAHEIGTALRRAVRRIEAATPRLGITLSGGLDSRFILGLCERPHEVPSFTWGEPGCRDIACAAAFAARVGSPHTVRHWEPEAFIPLWPLGSQLTAGSFGVESMFMLPYTGLLQSRADVILNGLAGDALLGGNFLQLSWIRESDHRRLGETSWRWRVSEEQDRTADRLIGGAQNRGREAWVDSVARERDSRPIERLNDWLYENRVFRNTNSGTMLLRHGVESHAPFFDRDVAEILLRTPLEYKQKHRLYLRVLSMECPAAASVPWQRTAIPPAWGFLANTGSMAFHRVARAGLKRVGITPFRSLSVADPGAWIRGPWNEAVRGLLLGDRTLSRGHVRPEALRELVDEHQGGANRTRQIGVLIAVELFCRSILERDEPAAAPALETSVR